MSGETIKLIEEKIEELYNSLMDKPLRVLGIFNDFFGIFCIFNKKTAFYDIFFILIDVWTTIFISTNWGKKSGFWGVPQQLFGKVA